MTAVEFRHVDVIFGPDPAAAARLLDDGLGRDEILEQTGNVIGVHDASLAVAEGEICVLMGLSGSGKSTLLRCVNGLNKAARGEVLVADGDNRVDVASCNAATLRRLRMNRIAMVFQQFALLPWRTVRENVGFGLELRGQAKAAREATVDDKLELVGLSAWGDKYAHELSGGMQQRVGLARAFATDADVLLMDEPFSALDPLIRDRLQDELLALQRALRKTIIFVSHDLDEALKLGNRIAILESGRLVQIGTPEEIITRPADDYVRAFVANVNPLNVLRAPTFMQPVAALQQNGPRIYLDSNHRYWCRVDAAGEVQACGDGERQVPWARADDEDAPGDTESAILAAGATVSLRRAIELHHQTAAPVPLLDDAGRLIGVVGAAEIIAAMNRGAGAPANMDGR